MTHEEACRALEENARRYGDGQVTLVQWRDELDRVMLTRYPGELGYRRARQPERGELETAARTSIQPRTPVAGSGRSAAQRPTHGAPQA